MTADRMAPIELPAKGAEASLLRREAPLPSRARPPARAARPAWRPARPLRRPGGPQGRRRPRAGRHATQRGKGRPRRNATAHAGKAQRRTVAAWIGVACAEADRGAARRRGAALDRPRAPGLAELMDAAERRVLAFTGFPARHRGPRSVPPTHGSASTARSRGARTGSASS